MTISPYELLRASRPQPSPSIVTPYDLYSCIKQKEPPIRQDAPSSFPQTPPAVHPGASPTVPSVRKTHYISDIHAKHSAADRRTSFISQPLHQ